MRQLQALKELDADILGSQIVEEDPIVWRNELNCTVDGRDKKVFRTMKPYKSHDGGIQKTKVLNVVAIQIFHLKKTMVYG